MLSLSAYRLSIPFREPMRTATGIMASRTLILVRAERDGSTGWGEAAPWPGQTPLDANATWREITSGSPRREPARSGVRAAEADLDARARGQALWEQLGGSEVPLVASRAISGGDPDAAVAAAGEAVAAGYTSVKLKIMPGADIEPLRAVTSSFPDLSVGVDANGAYTADAGLVGVAALRPAYVEQPFPPHRTDLAARFRQATGVTVVADESVVDLASARHVIAEGAADIVTVKLGRVGYDEAATIRRWANESGVQLKASGLFETSVGKAHTLAFATTPEVTMIDFAPTLDHLTFDVVSDPWEVTAGRVHPRHSPGTGVTVDEATVAEAAIVSTEIGA